MDLFGPINCKTITGESYCLVVTDEYSHFSWVVMLKHKSDTFEHIKVLILKLESLYKLKVRKICTDNGTEFKNNNMLLFCNEKGIQQQFSPSYTAQSNGCVEERFEVDIQRNAPARVSKGFTWQFEYDKLFNSFNFQPEATDDEILTQMLYDSHNSTENVISSPSLTQVQTQSIHQSPIQSPRQSTQSDHSNADPNVEMVYETDEDSDSEEDEDVNSARLTEEHLNPLYNQPPIVTGTEQPTEAGGVRRSNHVIMPPKFLYDYYVYTRGIPHVGIPHATTNEASTSEVPTISDVPVVSESQSVAEDVDSESTNVVTAFYSSLNKTGRVFVHAHSYYVCQIEPKDAYEALNFDEWVSAMQEELLQFKHLKVYVDDIIFGSMDQGMVDEFEKVMQWKFKMSSMGIIKFLLGLQVAQTDKGIFLHQTKYVADILKRFQANPNVHHMFVVKKILRYLKDTPRSGLWYPCEDGFDLTAYSDSDYGGGKKDFKSTSGGCQFLGSKLVTCLHITNTPIYVDNTAAIADTKNIVNHSKTKHIGIKYNFNRDCYDKKLIDVVQIDTTTQRADLFTKAFDKPRFEFLLKEIRIKFLTDVVPDTEASNTEEPPKETEL
ncbi:uncharacterized protein [Rutidosis leptorrhynchoides]|uniref:uncharacterized protein n=1 Tax=Rutidosis leptorrhynchoides TaxID=125765 RepID=UPI003A9A100A